MPTLKVFRNDRLNSFGNAVRFGLEKFEGDCVAIMMADLSDDPDDLVKFYHLMEKERVDCVFGNRFVKEGRVIDYPLPSSF